MRAAYVPVAALLCLGGCGGRHGEVAPSGEGGKVHITIDPHCVRAIRGISELRRETYFGLCDHGTDFDRRCRSKARYDWLIHENGITFGRRLGVVAGLDRYLKAIREDPARPGFADEALLVQRLADRRVQPGEDFRKDAGGRLEIAAHENHNAFPAFMGAHLSEAAGRESRPDRLPANIAAAARLTALALRHGYTDFDRPAFFEPINEPHWSYLGEEHLAQWHVATMGAIHREAPGVLVGGPCQSVAYFYKKGYRAFDGFRSFVDNTRCGLDFYSFHVYDFLRERDGDFGGRITSGLPLESVLDLVQNHAVNAHGKEIGIVVSEHGGYGARELAERLAKERFPGTGFEWEMKMRSIDDFNMVSSAIANTLVFMDHPHTIRKAVPFILLEAMAWDPEYYAVLYVPRDYRDRSDWVPTQKILFYRLFRDLKGHRVMASCADPDIQTRAFVDGGTLFVILNNLSNRTKEISLDMPRAKGVTLRRFGRNADRTPFLHEGPMASARALSLGGRQTAVIRSDCGKALEPRRAVDEIPCYGDRIAAEIAGETAFTVRVPGASRVCHATLRVGVSRPPDAGVDVRVVFNGKVLAVPVEGCAERLVEDEYASCKLIPLDAADIRGTNTIAVSFPDGRPGSVGAVVIRAAVQDQRRR